MSMKIVVIGGGTFSYVRSHLALSAPAFGTTAKQITYIAKDVFQNKHGLRDFSIDLTLTKMADPNSSIVTNKDVIHWLDAILDDLTVKVVFFTVAMCDFNGSILDYSTNIFGLETERGKHRPRLSSKEDYMMELTPTDKAIDAIKARRPDIIVIGFKTTAGETETGQYFKSLPLTEHCDYVLSNDIVARRNFYLKGRKAIVTPSYDDENRYRTLVKLVKDVRGRFASDAGFTP
jgi:hypothetical protein